MCLTKPNSVALRSVPDLQPDDIGLRDASTMHEPFFLSLARILVSLFSPATESRCQPRSFRSIPS